jgi:type I restriction enzyme R subunit
LGQKGWLNEDATRKTLIDKEIEKRGWNLNDERQVAQEYLIRFSQSETTEVINDQYVDYLLLDNVGDPLAVVEAKRYFLKRWIAINLVDNI